MSDRILHALPENPLPEGTLCVPLFLPDDSDYCSAFLTAIEYTLLLDRWWQRDEAKTARLVRRTFQDVTYKPLKEALLDDVRCEDESCEFPFWDEYTRQPAVDEDCDEPDSDAQEQFWNVADWIITGFIAVTATPGAAITYQTLAPKVRILLERRTLGAVADFFVNGVLVSSVDTSTGTGAPGELIENIIDISDLIESGAVPDGGDAGNVIRLAQQQVPAAVASVQTAGEFEAASQNTDTEIAVVTGNITYDEMTGDSSVTAQQVADGIELWHSRICSCLERGGGDSGESGAIDFVDEDGDGLDDRYNVGQSELAEAVALGGAFGEIEGFYNASGKIAQFLAQSPAPFVSEIVSYLTDVWSADAAEADNFAQYYNSNLPALVTGASVMSTEIAHVNHVFCGGVSGGAAVRRETYKHEAGLTAEQLEATRRLTRVFTQDQYATWHEQGRERPRFLAPLMSCFVFPPFKLTLDNPAAANNGTQYVVVSTDSYPGRSNQGFIVTASGVVTDSAGRRRDALYREVTPGAGDFEFDPLREIEFQDGTPLGLTPSAGQVSYREDHRYTWTVETDMLGIALFKIDDMSSDGLTGKIELTITHTGSEVEA